MRPQTWIVETKQPRALWLLLVATLAVAVILDQFRPPGGWLALEFPLWAGPIGTTTLSGWTAAERERALFGLGLDFLFLLLYPLYLSLLCDRAARYWRMPAHLARWAGVFGRLVLLAAPLDAAENVGLYWLLQGSQSGALQWLVTLAAGPKWLLALTTLAVAMICLCWRGWDRLRAYLQHRT